MVSNIIGKDELRKNVEETLNHISKTLSLSLGPHGSTAIIERSDRRHYTTKDGFTILKDIMIGNNIGNTIVDLIKRISEELVFKVGDGSTSAIIAAKELYFSLKRFEEKHKLRPKELIDLLKQCSEDIINILQDMARRVDVNDSEIVKNIASVSLNNDSDMGGMIQEIYKKISESGFINVKMSDTSETYYDILNGFELGNGYFDPIFKNSSTGECVLKNADVLLIDGKIDSPFIDTLNKIFVRYLDLASNPERTPLIIVAGGLDEEAKLFFRRTFLHLQQKNAPKMFNLIIPDIYTDKGRDIFADLTITLNAHPYKKDLGVEFEIENMDDMVGRVKEVVSNMWTTTFYLDKATDQHHIKLLDDRKDEIKFRLEYIEDSFDAKSEVEKFHLSKRFAMLEGNRLATIFVGGETDFEKECNKFLIDDAISACKSAFKYGYVLGGNIAICEAIYNIMVNNMKNDILVETKYYDMMTEIFESFKAVFYTVFKNRFTHDEDATNVIKPIFDKCVEEYVMYDLIDDTYSNTKIINSVQTDIEILRTTVSIISLIYSSNLFISVT